MITIAFRRFGNGIFVPHVDVLRNLNRTFRRAELDVSYSKGFVKHMKLNLTQPLPFGIADEDAYVAADVEPGDIASALTFFNESCPPFLQAKAIYRTDKNPNLAGLVTLSDYYLPAALSPEQIDRLNNLPSDYVVRQKKGDGIVERSTEGLIKSLRASSDGVSAKLAFGNVNLRVDVLAQQLNADFMTDFELTRIVRLSQSLVADGVEKTAENYLREIAAECVFLND
ncbi:MAG: TIGR03936 family radical SAM-associated protein [Clostridia bacterium]|nr:TIGR03936 family radical SAM-associated protein [Clostridia bacterium]